MKKFIIISILLTAVAAFIVFAFNLGNESDVTGSIIKESFAEKMEISNINKEESSFQFIGHAFAGLKKHEGTFDNFNVKLQIEGNKIIAMEGEAGTPSINTGIEKLDNHLKSSDFFDIEQFPKITFKSKSIENNQLAGDLTFHGVTKEITFPVTQTKNSISADFELNTHDFNFESSLVKKEVEIKFTFSV